MERRYRFNPQRLRYEPVLRGPRYYLRSWAPYVLLTLFLTAGFLGLFYSLYDSPRVRELKAQTQGLTAVVDANDTRLDSMQQSLAGLRLRNRNLYKEILNAEPLEFQATQGQKDTLSAILEEESFDVLENRVTKLAGRVDSQGLTQQRFVAMATERKAELARLPSIRPIPTEIISGFGMRRHPIFKRDFAHNGIDFKADLNSEVFATADGIVRQVGTPDKGLGLMVVVDHGNGYETRYAHLETALVRVGHRVKRGDVIARSGASGLCKGPHLYYEIRKDGDPVDPIDYFFHDLSPDQLIEFRRTSAQYNESMG